MFAYPVEHPFAITGVCKQNSVLIIHASTASTVWPLTIIDSGGDAGDGSGNGGGDGGDGGGDGGDGGGGDGEGTSSTASIVEVATVPTFTKGCCNTQFQKLPTFLKMRPSLKATLLFFLNALKSATFFAFEAILSCLYSDDSIASLPVTEALSIEHINASWSHSIYIFFSYFEGASCIFGSWS